MLTDTCFDKIESCLGSSLIDHLKEGVLVTDLKGYVMTVNKWFKDHLGYDKSDLIGLSYPEIYELLFVKDNLSYTDFKLNFQKVLRTKETLSFKRNLKDKNSNIISANCTLRPFYNSVGELIGVVASLTEIQDHILYDIAKNLNSFLALKDVLKNTNHEIVNQLGLSSNAIFLFDEDRAEVYLAVCNGWKEEALKKVRMKLGEGVPGQIAKEGKPIYVENLKTDPRIDPLSRSAHVDKSSIGYPMFFKDNLLGVVTFDAYGVRDFSKKELNLFQQIADFVSMIIYNAKAYERAVLLANTDELTGLLNHRCFQEVLEEEYKKASKEKKPLSMIMLDVDHFKGYNSAYGYTMGDILLKRIATLVKDKIGTKGKIARFGGDEFAILLPSLKSEEALLIADDLREKVENTSFNKLMPQIVDEKITVSLGVANYPLHADSKEDLVTCVSHALNLAKQRNRNRVVVYFSLMDDILNSVQKEEKDLLLTIKTLMRVIDAKDHYTVGHSERVTEYALFIGKELGLSEKDMQDLRYGAYLHDIGKIEISREILNKKGKLTEEEYAQIKKHPKNAVDLLTPIKSLSNIISMVKHHHERYDGSGYPMGLKGEEIPFLARVICVADSFDAIISSRPYRAAQNIEFAINELERCSGSQFDPKIVKAFVKVLKQQFYEFSKTAI